MKKNVSTICVFFALLFAVLPLTACAASGYSVFADAAFSDDMALTAKLVGRAPSTAFERMKNIISDIDCQVSLTHDSDLSRLNGASVGESVEVGEHCYRLFELSTEYYELTDGAFNAATAPLVRLWNVDAESLAELRPDLDGSYISPDLPTADEVAQTLAYCDPHLVESVEENGKYYLKKTDGRVKIDFGGIAKGYAVDLCVDVLDECGITSAMIDISGNLYLYGDYVGSGAPYWRVGISDPRPRAGQTLSRGYVCAVSLGGGVGAVTSGDYMRYYIHDNADGEKVYVPHIIAADGMPIGVEYSDGKWMNGDEWVISATVITDSGALGDALSTAVAALGIDGGGRLLQNLSCKGLIFTEKRYTILGEIELYKPDTYDGFKAYSYYEL